MAEIDLILVNGHVLTSGQLVDANVLVADGKIAGIVDPSCCPAARQTLDVSGLVVMPGMIDCHMHLGHGTSIAAPQVPGDADSESAAAAAGGITTFIPFILSTHDYTEVFSEIRDIMEAGSRIDFGMHFILANEMHLSRIQEARWQFRVDRMFFGAALIGTIGFILFALLKFVEAKLLAWKPSREAH